MCLLQYKKAWPFFLYTSLQADYENTIQSIYNCHHNSNIITVILADWLSIQMKSTKWSANLSHMQKKGCHGCTAVLTTLVLIFCAQYYTMLNNCTDNHWILWSQQLDHLTQVSDDSKTKRWLQVPHRRLQHVYNILQWWSWPQCHAKPASIAPCVIKAERWDMHSESF